MDARTAVVALAACLLLGVVVLRRGLDVWIVFTEDDIP